MATPLIEPKEGLGDVEAVWRTHHRMLRAHVSRFVPSAEVEDVLQEAFLAAWQAADRFDSSRDPGPWLATIARNRAIDRMRRRAVRPVTVVDDDELARLPTREAADPAEQLTRRHWGRAIDALRQLPDLQRRYMILHHVDGYSLVEIAHRDGTSVDSIKAHLYRARRSLRSALGHVAVWPSLLLHYLRRVLNSARTDSLSAATAGTIVATAATSLLVALPTAGPSGDGHAMATQVSVATTSTVDAAPRLRVATLGRPLAPQLQPLRQSHTAGDSPRAEGSIARLEADIPNPTTDDRERRKTLVWLEDDGNDSVIISSAETANDVACDTAANSCPRPIDWFKG